MVFSSLDCLICAGEGANGKRRGILQKWDGSLLKPCLCDVRRQKRVLNDERGEWSSLFDFSVGAVPKKHERTNHGNQSRCIWKLWRALFGCGALESDVHAIGVERMNFKRDRTWSADGTRAISFGDYGAHGSSLRNENGISGGYILGKNERKLIAYLCLLGGDVRIENEMDMRVAREQIFS